MSGLAISDYLRSAAPLPTSKAGINIRKEGALRRLPGITATEWLANESRMRLLVHRVLQRFPRLEAGCVRGGNLDGFTGAWIAPLTGSAGLHSKRTKANQRYATALGKCAPVIAPMAASSARPAEAFERSASAAMASIKSFLFTLVPLECVELKLAVAS